jgi:hypothetical protein
LKPDGGVAIRGWLDGDPVKQMFPGERHSTGHKSGAHDRGKDFLFAPSPPNLRVMSEGDKDDYR